MTDKNTTVNNEAPAMVCPVCGKEFYNLRSFSEHVNAHYEEEKKSNAEKARKEREEQRNRDIDELIMAYNELKNADKKFNKALDDYKAKYGGFVFPFRNDGINAILKHFGYHNTYM